MPISPIYCEICICTAQYAKAATAFYISLHSPPGAPNDAFSPRSAETAFVVGRPQGQPRVEWSCAAPEETAPVRASYSLSPEGLIGFLKGFVARDADVPQQVPIVAFRDLSQRAALL